MIKWREDLCAAGSRVYFEAYKYHYCTLSATLVRDRTGKIPIASVLPGTGMQKEHGHKSQWFSLLHVKLNTCHREH